MIKFQDLDLTDIKLHTASSELGFDKVAFGDEVIWEKSTSPLPSGYTEVKYLESKGKQGINLNKTMGFLDRDVIDWELVFSLTNVGTTQIILGTANGYSRGKQIVFIGKRVRGDYATGQIPYFSSSIEKNEKHIFKQIGNQLLFDDESMLITFRISQSDNAYSNPVGLFWRYPGNDKAYVRIESFKISENNILVTNLIPCLDINNTPCMYDTVTQQTLYNAGTGTFGYETMDGTVVAPT